MSILDFIFGNNKKEEEDRLERERQEKARKEREEKARLDAERRKREQESSSVEPFVFKSNCHQRYESGEPKLGLQECIRTIRVEKNANGCSGYRLAPGEGYIVKIYNDDLGKPNMSDKPMKVVRRTDNILELRGFPIEAQSPFGWQEIDLSDYGLVVYYENGQVSKCVLHMYDRDTYIEYSQKDIQPPDFNITINGMTKKIEVNVLAKTMPMFEKAKKLYEATQYAESAKLFGQMIELQPDNANWYTYRGTAYEDMGIDSMAKTDFQKAISLSPKDCLPLYRLGMLFTRENNNEKAVEYLQRAFDNSLLYIENPMGEGLDNNMLFIHKKIIGNNLGHYLCQLGKNKEAYEVLDDVIANCPNYSYAYFTKGLALANEGKYHESTPLVQMAQKLGHPRAADLFAYVAQQSNVMGKSKNSDFDDRYSNMVRQTSFNPFNITLDPIANKTIQLPDLVEVFHQELENLFSRLPSPINTETFIQVLSGYAFNLIESYYNNAGMVPKLAMDEILRQVYRACSKTSKSNYLSQFSLEDFMYHQYYSLTHN